MLLKDFEFDNQNILKVLKEKKQDYSNEKTINLFSDLIENNEVLDKKVFYKGDRKFEIFREYTDCLYSAYGTKWNGNAAAYNGSLYISQDDRIRRFTPLECERLMGFPDNYTLVNGNSDTNRFQAIGNSWAVPVVKWIGDQISNFLKHKINQEITCWHKATKKTNNNLSANLYLVDKVMLINQKLYLNSSIVPNSPIDSTIEDIVQVDNVPEKFYLSPQACRGILRRKQERDLKMNSKLEKLMTIIGQQELINQEACQEI